MNQNINHKSYLLRLFKFYLDDGVLAGGVNLEIVRHFSAPAFRGNQAVLPHLGLDDGEDGALRIGHDDLVILQGEDQIASTSTFNIKLGKRLQVRKKFLRHFRSVTKDKYLG